MDREPKNLQAELDAKMGEVSGLLSASTTDIAAIREALELLKRSSNSTFPGTIVFDAIQKFETAIERIEVKTVHYEGQILGILDRIRREILRHNHNPATSVTITQIGSSPMLSISPSNAPQFQAALQPANAGPFVASNVAWSVTGDPGASTSQIPSDPTGLTVTLTLTPETVVGSTLSLNVVVTNQDGTSVTATDVLTVVSSGTPPANFVNATGAAIQQIS
jgi:hypothetical protein